ncbi:MAG: efflux transporter outer membrane subunit, partial [Desulfuromonadaceae bacterium]|nr:efflux transporter outer membrane subunit [Desulfuromonadaceae bacterium]
PHRAQRATLPGALPENYTADSGLNAERPLERWWLQFQDPLLDSLMAEAFEYNLDLEQAHARLEQFEAQARIAGAARLPAVGLQGGAGRVRQPGLFGVQTDNSYRLSVAASFELDVWRKLASRSEAARLDTLAARQDVAALYLSLSARLADLYYLAVEQRSQLALVDGTIASFADTLQRVENRYREGLVPALDVYQSRQNLAVAKASRPLFEASLASAEHALAVLLGRLPDRSTAGSLAELPALEGAFPVGLPATMLQRRPDIAGALTRLQATDARVAAAIAERFPSFNLVADYGAADSELGSLLDSPNIFWNLLANLAQPLIDGGRRKAEVDRTRALFRENLGFYHQTVLQAFQEVEDALVQEKTGTRRIELLEERVVATAGSLRLSTDRYLQGLSEYLPVLTAQIAHAEAQSALLATKRQRIVARISLARALGGNWMDSFVEQRLSK